jgi:hypothetical protein
MSIVRRVRDSEMAGADWRFSEAEIQHGFSRPCSLDASRPHQQIQSKERSIVHFIQLMHDQGLDGSYVLGDYVQFSPCGSILFSHGDEPPIVVVVRKASRPETTVAPSAINPG